MILYYILKKREAAFVKIKYSNYIKFLIKKKLHVTYAKKLKTKNLVTPYKNQSIIKKLCSYRRVLMFLTTIKYNNVLKFNYRIKTICEVLNTLKLILKTKRRLLQLPKPVERSRKLKKYVVFILNILVTRTNTFLIITDIKGNPKKILSVGQLKQGGKQKKKQPNAILALLKYLQYNLNNFHCFPVALHFYNVKSHLEFLFVRRLRKFFFINTIKSFNLAPHNGCRPPKLRRKK